MSQLQLVSIQIITLHYGLACALPFSHFCVSMAHFLPEKSQVLNLHSCQHFLGIQFRLVHLMVSTEEPPFTPPPIRDPPMFPSELTFHLFPVCTAGDGM